jgi:hypothetical protein
MPSKRLYCSSYGFLTEHQIAGSNGMTALLCLQYLVRWARK